MGKRVADVLVDTLVAGRVERIYGLAGDSLNGIAETTEQVRPMIAKALQHDGPALVEVLVSRQELAMPLHARADDWLQPLHAPAVLTGRGDEVIDLAKVHLFRSGRSPAVSWWRRPRHLRLFVWSSAAFRACASFAGVSTAQKCM